MSVSLEKNIINLLYTSQFLVIKILRTSEIYTGDWVAEDKFYRLHILFSCSPSLPFFLSFSLSCLSLPPLPLLVLLTPTKPLPFILSMCSVHSSLVRFTNLFLYFSNLDYSSTLYLQV